MAEEELEKLIEKAAERGADKAITKLTDKVYKEVGRSVLGKIFSLAGAVIIALWFYGRDQGWLK